MKLPFNPHKGELQPEEPLHRWEDTRTSCYIKLKRFPDALKSLNISIVSKAGTNDPWSLCTRGMIYFQMKDYDKAIADFSVSIAKDPSYSNHVAYAKFDQPDKKNADLVTLEALKKEATTNKAPDIYAVLSSKSSDLSTVLFAKTISDRRKQIVAEALKLEPAAVPAKMK